MWKAVTNKFLPTAVLLAAFNSATFVRVNICQDAAGNFSHTHVHCMTYSLTEEEVSARLTITFYVTSKRVN